MIIKILGTGCTKCKKLESHAKEAVEKSGISAEVLKVEDIKDIMKYGVMSTPAIVINEKVKMYGKICSIDEIVKFIQEEK